MRECAPCRGAYADRKEPWHPLASREWQAPCYTVRTGKRNGPRLSIERQSSREIPLTSGLGLRGHALVLEERLQLAGLEHLAHDVAAAHELALHVKLRN